MIKQSEKNLNDTIEKIEDSITAQTDFVQDNIDNSAGNSAENFAIQTNSSDNKNLPQKKQTDKKNSIKQNHQENITVENSEFEDGYKVHLDNFEGPLDLLLYLIKEAKIDIKDIFISKVTDQYLSYMQNISQLDLEKASEFLSTAATILEIKSNSLLPKMEEIEGDTEDPAKKMIRKLEEYKIIKESAEKLKGLEEINSFYRMPDDSVYNVKVVLKDMTLEGLLDAFSKLMSKVTQKQNEINSPKEIVRDPFTVDEKITYIRQTLTERRSLMFSELFEGDYNKSEVITTFQAMLELIRRQFLEVIQAINYEDIKINICEEINGEA